MTKVLDAAQRVAALVQEKRDKEAAGVAEVARVDRERDLATHREDAAREAARRAFEDLKTAGADAFAAATEALKRLDTAERVAVSLMDDHAREHAARRDVASDKLDRLLAGVGPELRRRTARFVAQIADVNEQPTVADALRLAEAAGQAGRVDEIGGVLRGLLDAGTYSPLTSEEFLAVRAAARVHRDAVKTALMNGREHAAAVGEALRRLRAGVEADAASPAALVLDANERAQAALRDLRAVLYPTTNAEEATR